MDLGCLILMRNDSGVYLSYAAVECVYSTAGLFIVHYCNKICGINKCQKFS